MCCVVLVKEGPERNTRKIYHDAAQISKSTRTVVAKRARRRPETESSTSRDANLDARIA
jgi:hypothetical protein